MANIITSKGGVNSYTRGWLEYMAEWSGMSKEDVELISICDIDDFGLLLRPKTAKVRIVGGAEAVNDALYRPFCDGLVFGEGFLFFRDFKATGRLDFNRPYHVDQASDYVDWNHAPPIKVGPKKVMILSGRGCKNKCKFCFTSWTTRHQVRQSINYRETGAVVNIITNDSAGSLNQKVPARSITIHDYLGMSKKQAELCRVYRFGLESFTESGRKSLGKPIKNEIVKAAFHVARRMKHEIIFFIIAGIEQQESVLEFLETCGADAAISPRVIVKGTYFNPCLHTPLQDFDLRNLHQWDKKWIYGQLKKASPRFRLNIRADSGYSVWRGIMHRAKSREQAIKIWSWRNKTRSEIEDLVEANGWSELWTDRNVSAVTFPWMKSL